MAAPIPPIQAVLKLGFYVLANERNRDQAIKEIAFLHSTEIIDRTCRLPLRVDAGTRARYAHDQGPSSSRRNRSA
jgi:hypothetical protein